MITLSGAVADARADAPPAKTRIAFIDIGRALAALLVFYSHLVEQWVRPHGENAPYIDFVDNLTSKPMVMGFQGIGEISVPFFFLVSGFVVTPIALRQGQSKFGVNRLIRVYAPMIVAVLLAALMVILNLNARPHGVPPQPVTPTTVLTNATLANYLILPQVTLVPVAWTLIVEMFFYVLLIALIPLLRRQVWFALALELTLVFVALMTARAFGPVWFLVAVNMSYLPILLIGQIMWACTSGKIPVWLAGVLGGMAWGLYVLADMRDMGRIDGSYNMALAFAVVLFGLGYFAESRLKERKIWIALSERSYSIYLLHMLSFAALTGLRPFLPLWLCLIIAISATFGVVELSYRLVERPSHRLARKLSRRTKDGGRKPDMMKELAEEVTTMTIDRVADDEREEFVDRPDDGLPPQRTRGPLRPPPEPAGPRPPQDRLGPDRLSSDRPGPDRPAHDRPDQDRLGPDRPGQDRSGQDRRQPVLDRRAEPPRRPGPPPRRPAPPPWEVRGPNGAERPRHTDVETARTNGVLPPDRPDFGRPEPSMPMPPPNRPMPPDRSLPGRSLPPPGGRRDEAWRTNGGGRRRADPDHEYEEPGADLELADDEFDEFDEPPTPPPPARPRPSPRPRPRQDGPVNGMHHPDPDDDRPSGRRARHRA